jgi:hypothetical protein
VKKLLPVLIFIVILILLFVFTLSSQKSKTPVDGKFGFLRNAFDMKLEKIEDTGATWFRPNFGYFVWGVMQKNENAQIDFSKTDEVVANSQKEGLHLIVTLFPYADWDQKEKGEKCRVLSSDSSLPMTKGGFTTPGLTYYRCNPSDWIAYQKWLTALVERYDGDGKDDMPRLEYPVNYYEILNEPDLTLGPGGDGGTVYYLDTPENYAVLLQKSYSTIKSADNRSQVVIAALAGVQPQFTKYWERIFAVPKIADYFDIANIHCISAPNQDKNDPTSASAEDLNVTVYKNLLAKYKIFKPIWVTEAENIQGNDVEENVERLKNSVKNALKNGAEKIFFTGASFANDPMRYTSEIFLNEKSYYNDIILSTK